MNVCLSLAMSTVLILSYPVDEDAPGHKRLTPYQRGQKRKAEAMARGNALQPEPISVASKRQKESGTDILGKQHCH
jgi:hypothetical protein